MNREEEKQAEEPERSCSCCRFRFVRMWTGMESCLDYEMAETEEECRKAAADCPKYEKGAPEGRDEGHYTPSATADDYGPSDPWDAPGMSVRDFI